MTYRPELAAIHESHARAALQEKLARAEYNPDFTLGLGVQGMGMRNSEFYQPNSDERTDSLQASISMNIPIPNARRRAAVAQAQKRAEEMQLREDSLTDQIMESIAANVAQITSLREQITLYENSILPLAEESFLAADASYRSAKGNYIDLLDAQRTLLTARREQLRINRDHDLAVADLERAIALPLGLIARAKESLQ
jgi:outer membrane protein TolC